MHRDASWLAGAALDFGKRMQAAIDSIPFKHETTNQIIKALLTGEKSGIPEEVSAAFRNSGASHILALSGLHLGLIYGVVHFVTRCIGNTPKAKAARSAILVCACGFYTLATGAGASIVRAFIFIIIGECARLSGRNAGLRDVMMAALLIHLSITPSAIKEPGFQLSYAAIAGIAYIFPWMQGFWPGNRHEDAALTKCARWVWDSAAMSISCQITTGPLAYMYFGTFPAQFILTNMIALPLTGIIIPMALATLAACSMGWELPILIDVTEWMITALCGSLGLLSTM
jgi:competence protein ComEC